MPQFKVGDRVSVTGWIQDRAFDQALGTIRAINHAMSLEVAFDNWDDGYYGSTGDPRVTDRWFIDAQYHDTVTVIASEDAKITNAYTLLPHTSGERKMIPLASGVFDYFTSALIEVAKVSFKGNEQHNPGEPLHWARGKSADHADTMLRHFAERGSCDSDGTRHSAKMVWRALALLQMELENEGYPKARGAS